MRKILVAGATGAIGKQLLPRLVAAGHDVVGTTSSDTKRDLIKTFGATPAVMNGLDPDSVAKVVAEAEPDVIVHQMTALSGPVDLRHFDRTFELTNRLRIEGTDNLLSAARATGVQRFVAQSFAGWPSARTGGPVKTEDDDLDPTPAAPLRSTLAAIRHLEEAVTGADWIDGVALRYGGFYGPGTSLEPPDGEQIRMILKHRFPIVGDGAGVWSFVHIADAAEATVIATERGTRGIYNVVDDSPVPVSEALPRIAAAVGAKPPMHLPKWIGRIVGGEAAVVMMTEVRGASNAKAKQVLDWQPRHPSIWQALGASG